MTFLSYGISYLTTPLDKSPQSIEKTLIKTPVSRWRLADDTTKNRNSFDDEVKRLTSLGYLQGYNKAPPKQSVIVYDENLAHDGFNLYNSGHAEEAVIMDMRGNILHKWTCDKCDIEKVWEKWGILDFDKSKEARSYWRRVFLYDNGDILAIYEGLLMVKLDKDSNLLWITKISRTHHHMQVDENGKIYVLQHKSTMIPKLNKHEKVIEDYIVILNPEGGNY